MSRAFLERMTLIPTERGATLEALYHRGDRGLPVVLAPSRPALGSMMDSAVLSELCWSLTQAGHPTLRFNWAGVGASTGTSSSGDANRDLEDLRDAIHSLRETEARPRVAVVGYGHGAEVAMMAAVSLGSIDRAVAVSPLVVPPVPEVPARLFIGDADPHAPEGLQERWGDAMQVIPDADHAFNRSLAPLRDAVLRFFAGD